MEEKGNFNENRLMQNYIVQKNEVIRSDSVKIKISITEMLNRYPSKTDFEGSLAFCFARIGICVATRHVICHYDVFVLFAFCCCFFFIVFHFLIRFFPLFCSYHCVAVFLFQARVAEIKSTSLSI